jgi:hypothetical protein
MTRIIDAFTEDGSWGNDNVFATKGTRLNQADALVRDPLYTYNHNIIDSA